MACALLRLAAAGLALGAARDVSLGSAAPSSDRRSRKDRVQYQAFRILRPIPLHGPYGGSFHGQGAWLDQLPGPTHPRQIPWDSRPMARPDIRGGLTRGRGPAAPLSRPELMLTSCRLDRWQQGEFAMRIRDRPFFSSV